MLLTNCSRAMGCTTSWLASACRAGTRQHRSALLDLLDQEQLQSAYRGDWLCRKIIDVPAFDSCRTWRDWHADNDQIEKIEEAERCSACSAS